MKDSLEAWRDTLKDLGVLGLVREPVASAPARGTPVSAGSSNLEPTSLRPRPPVVPGPRPAPAAPQQAAYVPPASGPGCPPPGLVAGCNSLPELEAAIRECLACPLGPGRMKFVFGEGNPKARLMFVGEGPGRDEDLQGRPFVGKAGELLDRMIGALGLKREDTYIANVVKCRPPDNRTPTPDEARACMGYLHRQIELIQPAVIVTLGATPLRELLGVSEGITRTRGQWRQLKVGDREIPVMPTFHPAYVLRQYTQEVRRVVWEDLKAAKAWMDAPPG